MVMLNMMMISVCEYVSGNELLLSYMSLLYCYDYFYLFLSFISIMACVNSPMRGNKDLLN